MAKKVSTKKTKTVEQAEPQVILRPDVDQAIEKRLVALYTLQSVDSEIDKIQIIRGELPQAVQDLEDEIAGLNTRIENFNSEIKETETANKARNAEISDHEEQIKKYQKQQDNVRNNREYESLAKEIEFQNLEIQLCERKNKEGAAKVKELKEHIASAKTLVENRTKDLDAKREELTSIIAETEKDEKRLREKSAEQEQFIDELIRRAGAVHRRTLPDSLQAHPRCRPQRPGRGANRPRLLRWLLQQHPAPTPDGNQDAQESHRLRELRPHPRR